VEPVKDNAGFGTKEGKGDEKQAYLVKTNGVYLIYHFIIAEIQSLSFEFYIYSSTRQLKLSHDC